MARVVFRYGLAISSLFFLTESPLQAQSVSEEPSLEETIQQTIPPNTEPLPDRQPTSRDRKPKITTLEANVLGKCQLDSKASIIDYRDRFFIREILVKGNTVLYAEIEQIIANSQLKYRTATFEDLVCLRSQITSLYLDRGYVTSGAFLANNQDLSTGLITIQIVEGELEEIVLTGLERLQESYLRQRLAAASQKPLNIRELETGLQLLVLNPLFQRVDAELTAGQKPGNNILLVDVKQANSFTAGIAFDNYRSPSIGEFQGSVNLAHGNLLGFGDRVYAEYGFTEGLDIYSAGYAIPWNVKNGTLSFSYNNSDSGVITEQFRDLDIDSETETFSVALSQPLKLTPNEEFTVGISLDVRERKTFLNGEPFSFSLGAEDGESRVSVLRFTQDWVKRDASSVLAARSRFSLGIDAFDATFNDTGTDGNFLTWQAQAQWVKQFRPGLLFIARFGGQFTGDSLLSLEQFSLGGVNTVRGYRENQLVTDSGIVSTLEMQIPLTKNPDTLQLNPFFEIGTGWNDNEPDPEDATLASIGMGVRWNISGGLLLNVDYGIPLLDVGDEGDSLQENGFHVSVSYQPSF